MAQRADAPVPGVVAGGGGGVHAKRAVETNVTLATRCSEVRAVTELPAQALLALADVPQSLGIAEGSRWTRRPVAPSASWAVEPFRT